MSDLGMVSAMKSQRQYDLGLTPRPAVVQFVYADGRMSAPYAIETQLLEVPEDVLSVEIRQLPVYPQDFPAGDEPGWGNDDSPEGLGEAAVARMEVRGRERFQGPPAR